MNMAAPIAASNIEAEAALCGALMCENKLIDPIADMLTPEDFAEPLHSRIFAAIVAQAARGQPVTPITLRPYLEADPALHEVGGLSYLAQLTGSGAAVIGARGFAEQVKELAQRRRLLDGLQDALEAGHGIETGLHEVAAVAEAALAELAEEVSGSEELTAAEAVKRRIAAFDDDQAAGTRSGIEALDAAWGPLRAKSVNIVGGRPGMGKTALAVSYGVGAARNGHGVLFISLEMSAEELSERIVSDMCFDDERRRIPFNAISSGNLNGDQKRQMCRVQEELESIPLTIVDTTAATSAKVDRLVRRYARRYAAAGHKLELVIVDYLGLMRPDRKRDKTYEEVSEVSRGLKETAKRHGIAIMALHQLSRKVEERADKRPNMADLRDSGQIEQDADSILFLFAPEYYLAREEPPIGDAKRDEWERDMREAQGHLNFIVAKRRRGPAAVGRGFFYRHYQAVRG